MMGKQARVSKNDTLPGLGSIKQLRVILVILPLPLCMGYRRAANNFPAGAGQIVWSNLFLLGHIPFLAGQTSITSYRYKSAGDKI